MAQGNGSLRGSLPKRHDGGEMFDSKGVTNLEHPQHVRPSVDDSSVDHHHHCRFVIPQLACGSNIRAK